MFISYSRDDVELAKAIYKRLKKYEFNVWIDFSGILSGDNYADRIKNALLNAVNNGYVIALLNERIFNPHSWTKVELSIALKQGEHPERSIIPVVQDHSILERLERDSALALLSTVQAIDSSNIELSQRSDFVVDTIIRRLLPPGQYCLMPKTS
ncbi:MAG: toll/interleukin-1 receptor domain-containing protein [Prevotella sp.]|nr:toll/interleukin-1 receptor domain-containing protein [Prevotella sp.]